MIDQQLKRYKELLLAREVAGTLDGSEPWNDPTEKELDEVWRGLQGFAHPNPFADYNFNSSHRAVAAYAHDQFVIAFIKTNFPDEYAAAVAACKAQAAKENSPIVCQTATASSV